MNQTTYSPEQQRAVLASHLRAGAYRTMALLHRRMDQLIDLALERAMSDEALAKYGDAMFHQSFPELTRETLEELADALNRQAVYDARAKGHHP